MIRNKRYFGLETLEPRTLFNALANSGFDATAIPTYAYCPTSPGWIFTGNAGIEANGSAWNGPDGIDGTQAAFLQSGQAWAGQTSGQISQTLTLSAGTYALSFSAALRAYQVNAPAQSVGLYIDGSLVNTFSPTSTAWSQFSTLLTVSGGSHTIAFSAMVPTGDTSAFIDAVDLEPYNASSPLVNGSFDATGANRYTYDPLGTGWTFIGNAGIQANGSAWGAAPAPDGVQTAFLQSGGQTGGQISQTLTIADAGTYSLSFAAALRSYRVGNTPQQIAVTLDAQAVGTFAPTSVTAWDSFAATLQLSQGTHTLTFRAAFDAGDTSAFLDHVNLVMVQPPQPAPAPPPQPAAVYDNVIRHDSAGNLYVFAAEPLDMGATWTPADPGTELFGADGIPNPDSVHQTAIADCWVDATIASFAMASPAKLESIVGFNGQSYWVKLAGNGSPFQPTITVYMDTSFSQSLQVEAGGEVWPLVIEKGMAYGRFFSTLNTDSQNAAQNKFSTLNFGSSISMLAELGEAPVNVQFWSRDPQTVYTTILDNVAAHRPMVMETGGDATLVGNHAYSIVGAQMIDGSLTVLLRNPWGIDGPFGDASNDGYVTVSLNVIRASSTSFYWGV